MTNKERLEANNAIIDEIQETLKNKIVAAGGGVTDYNALTNKPSINGVVLEDDKTADKLGIASTSQINDINVDIDDLKSGKADKSYVEYVEDIAKGASMSISFGTYFEMINGVGNANETLYTIGKNVMIITLNVPDLWISGVSATYNEYVYTTDEDFIAQLSANGKVQVGHYFLSALETQKVNLVDYVKKDDIELTLKSNGAYTLTINKG